METVFEKIGFGNIPHPVMYAIASSIFLLPLILMCYVLCCMKDDYVDERRPQQQVHAEAAKKPASSRRDKLE